MTDIKKPFNKDKRLSVPTVSSSKYESSNTSGKSNEFKMNTILLKISIILDALPFNHTSTSFKPYRSVYTREPFSSYSPRSTSTSVLSPSTTQYNQSPLIQKSTSLTSVPPATTPTTTTNPAYVDKKLKVQVVKSKKPCDVGQQKVPTYKTSPKNKGKVLVISNIKFLDEKQYRQGAEIDEKNIVQLFEQMGMKVQIHR